MNRTVTTSVAVSALAAYAILCAPCVGPTAMAEQSSQQSDAPRLPKAELIKTITEPQPRAEALQHRAYRITGKGTGEIDHKYTTLAGPVSQPLPSNLAERSKEASSGRAEVEPTSAILGAEAQWTTQTGYALMWGWWPLATSPTTRIGTEGRGVVLVIADPEKLREIIVHLEGSLTRVQEQANTKHSQTLTTPRSFVVVTKNSDGAVIIEPPALITLGSSLDEFVGRVMNWRTEIEP